MKMTKKTSRKTLKNMRIIIWSVKVKRQSRVRTVVVWIYHARLEIVTCRKYNQTHLHQPQACYQMAWIQICSKMWHSKWRHKIQKAIRSNNSFKMSLNSYGNNEKRRSWPSSASYCSNFKNKMTNMAMRNKMKTRMRKKRTWIKRSKRAKGKVKKLMKMILKYKKWRPNLIKY